MAKGNLKKFLAHEWLMFWIFGLFWAADMFLPLYLTGSFDNEAEAFKNFLIMFGPYLIYLMVRLLFLIGKSLGWAYLTSNIFFRSKLERSLAEEWFWFFLLVIVWSLLMAYPMYLVGMFSDRPSIVLIAVVLGAPYMLFWSARLLSALFRSLGWAIKETVKK